MLYLALCVLVFVVAYLVNIVTITVGYHRGLAHNALRLHPVLRRIVIVGGNWLTGLDPKAWAVMHRLHHEHSDTPSDPHSPVNVGIVGIMKEQLRSYERVIRGLKRNDPRFTKYAQDFEFELNWLNRKGVWFLPYLIHAAVGIGIGLSTGLWLLAACYFLGMMSHPIQGGLVNSFGHAVGGRNFETPDNSRNNHLIAWLVLGEGFQNNHNRYPASARFSHRSWEFDGGYTVCKLLSAVGLVKIERKLLMPRARELAALRTAEQAG